MLGDHFLSKSLFIQGFLSQQEEDQTNGSFASHGGQPGTQDSIPCSGFGPVKSKGSLEGELVLTESLTGVRTTFESPL